MYGHHLASLSPPPPLGADDIQQLKQLNNSEFEQLCIMVGMATKPFHVMRFQKALQRHSHLAQITPVSVLQVGIATTASPQPPPFISGTHVQQSPARSVAPVGTILSPLHLASLHPATSSTPLQFPAHLQLPSVGGNSASAASDLSQQICSSSSPQSSIAGVIAPQPKHSNAVNVQSEPHSGSAAMMPQAQREADRKLFLPPYLQPNSDCRSFDDLIDDLTPVQKTLGPCPFSPNIWDAQRADLIRKYAAIYGQNASKRKNGQLNAFEENVNEAANQLCLRDPTLLVRREELFTLARRALKEGGYAFYHGFSHGKECKNSLVSVVAVPQKRQPDDHDHECEEQHTKEPYLSLSERKKRRIDRITALEILISTNKSEQSLKLAALEKAQQSNDFSTAYHIQMEIESLGSRCMTLQTEYSSLKKKHHRSERYFKRKQQLKVVRKQGSQAVSAGTSNDDINSSSSDEHLVAATCTTHTANLTHHTNPGRMGSPSACTQIRPTESRNFLRPSYHEEFARSVPTHPQHLPPQTPYSTLQPVPFYRSPVTAQFVCDRNPQSDEAEELVATVTQCASEVSRLLMKFDNTHDVSSSHSGINNTQMMDISSYGASSHATKL